VQLNKWRIFLSHLGPPVFIITLTNLAGALPPPAAHRTGMPQSLPTPILLTTPPHRPAASVKVRWPCVEPWDKEGRARMGRFMLLLSLFVAMGLLLYGLFDGSWTVLGYNKVRHPGRRTLPAAGGEAHPPGLASSRWSLSPSAAGVAHRPTPHNIRLSAWLAVT